MPLKNLNLSIRTTLFALLLPAAILLMLAAWLIHGALLDNMSRDFVKEQLKEEVEFLENQLIRNQSGVSRNVINTSYFDEVLHHAFAIQQGDETFIYPTSWEKHLTPIVNDEKQGYRQESHVESEGMGEEFLAYKQTFELNDQRYTIVVAEDLTNFNQSQSDMHTWTAFVSVSLLILLLLVIWLSVRLSLRSVLSLRKAIEELQVGTRERIDFDVQEEFKPLVIQVNQLSTSLEDRLKSSRQALENFSHSVKTPIAAVRQVLEDSSVQLDDKHRQTMVRKLFDIDRQLESEMRRHSLAGPNVGKMSSPVLQARDLLWMLGRLHPDKSFELETELEHSHRWPVEEHDLNEVLGNLLDNAGKWAKQKVSLSLIETMNERIIEINDDGIGVNSERLSLLGERGLRLDEQTHGHGLGVAITKEIVLRYGGVIDFSLNVGAGLKVRIGFKKKEITK